MSRSIDSRPLAPFARSVKFKIPVHVASCTSLIQGVGSETVTQLLQLLTTPNLKQAGLENVSHAQISLCIHGCNATTPHHCPIG